MRVLLTGSTGFIGRHVLQALLSRGIDVVTVGRARPDSAVAHLDVDLLACGDYGQLVGQAGATHLLHLAWYVEHGAYWTSPLNLRWVEASTRLVEAFCASRGQKVMMAGTCAEYDWSGGSCREEFTPLKPQMLYGVAKDATRRLAMAVCKQHKVPCSWGRIFFPYGRGESPKRLVPSLIDVFRGLRAPFGVNAAACRDLLHVSDVAEGVLALLLRGEHGAYNISSGEPTRLEEVVRLLADRIGGDPAPILALPSGRQGEPGLLVGENLKLKALGWTPNVSLAQGLDRVLREETA